MPLDRAHTAHTHTSIMHPTASISHPTSYTRNAPINTHSSIAIPVANITAKLDSAKFIKRAPLPSFFLASKSSNPNISLFLEKTTYKVCNRQEQESQLFLQMKETNLLPAGRRKSPTCNLMNQRNQEGSPSNQDLARRMN